MRITGPLGAGRPAPRLFPPGAAPGPGILASGSLRRPGEAASGVAAAFGARAAARTDLARLPASALGSWLAALAALGLGAALAFVSLPSSWGWLAPAPLAGIFALLAAPSGSPRSAFRLSFLAGLGFFALHLAWLPESFSALFGPIGAAPMPLLVLALASMWGLTGGATRALARGFTLLALPFSWTLLDALRALGPLGFTWGNLGYAFAGAPVVQVADLGGVGLLELLVTGLAAAGAALILAWAGLAPRPSRWLLGLPVLATGLAFTYGLTRPEPPAATKTALLVQGSVDPRERAKRRQAGELDLYLKLSQDGLERSPGKVNLIVWPETAAPAAPSDPNVARRLRALNAPLILGAPADDGATLRNSAFGFLGGVTGRYDKVKLVPFGEFFPLRRQLNFVYNRVFAAFGLPVLRGETPGMAFTPLNLGALRVGVYICYESTFPAVARNMVLGGATLLVNISNDAWFGRSVGAEQHFLMGRLRAIETRRYLLRAGNDGITAVIDPLGRVGARLARGARGSLVVRYAEASGLSLYTRLGDWPALASTLALVLIGALKRAGRARPEPGGFYVP